MTWQLHSMGHFYDAGEPSVVYFDSRSGDTHLLSAFAACVLERIAGASVSTEELVDRVAPLVDMDSRTELSASVRTVLNELVALDIVQRQ